MKKQIITTLLLGVTSLSFAQMSRSECIVQLNKLVTEIKLDIKTSDLDIEKAADNYNHRGKINFQEITEKTIVYQIEDFELKTKIKIEYSNIDWNHLRATRIGSSNYVDIAHSKDLGFISLDFDSNKNTIIYKEYKNNNLILKETEWDTADLFYDKKDLDEIEILINRLLEIAENAISVNLTEIKKEPALKEIRDKIFDDLRDNRVKGASTGSDIGDLSEFTTPPPNYKTDASIKTKEYDKVSSSHSFNNNEIEFLQKIANNSSLNTIKKYMEENNYSYTEDFEDENCYGYSFNNKQGHISIAYTSSQKLAIIILIVPTLSISFSEQALKNNNFIIIKKDEETVIWKKDKYSYQFLTEKSEDPAGTLILMTKEYEHYIK